MLLATAASSALYLGLAIAGWGGWSAFLAHPARAGAHIATVAFSVLAIPGPMQFDAQPQDAILIFGTRGRRLFEPGPRLSNLQAGNRAAGARIQAQPTGLRVQVVEGEDHAE